MSDLTEKWKAGELEDGDYYIKTSGVIIPMYFDGLYFEGADDKDIQEVIAPVPTYAELQELKSNRDKLAYDLGVDDVKNGELLRLLKEWVEAYPVVAVTCDLKNFAKITELLDKTNEVLK